jgi:quercetin dioxygenase-like cupin family protein
MTEPYIRAGNVNWIARGSDVGVQERTLHAGDVIPWHYHTVITDTTYCLEGVVRIEMLEPAECVLLTPGQSQPIPPNRPHQITPEGDQPCRFLLVQGVEKYDRHAIDPQAYSASAADTSTNDER